MEGMHRRPHSQSATTQTRSEHQHPASRLALPPTYMPLRSAPASLHRPHVMPPFMGRHPAGSQAATAGQQPQLRSPQRGSINAGKQFVPAAQPHGRAHHTSSAQATSAASQPEARAPRLSRGFFPEGTRLSAPPPPPEEPASRLGGGCEEGDMDLHQPPADAQGAALRG